MLEWLAGFLRHYPELTFFLTIAIGYLLGKIRIGSFTLGAVTGVLLAAVVIGQLGITLPGAVKQIFFLLFLFSIGYRTGPQFFRGLKSDGLQQAGLACIFALTAILVAWLVSRVMGYEAGTGAGLIAGALTESATIGTAADAISRLDVAEEVRTHLANQIPVAFAVTYLVGVIAAAWFLSQVAPKLMGVPDLAAACRELEQQMGGVGSGGALRTASGFMALRAYVVRPGGWLDGRSIAAIESSVPDARVFVERLRQNGAIVEPAPEIVLRPGDIAAIAARHEVLVEHLGPNLREVADAELTDLEVDVLDVVLTNRGLDGKTLADLGGRPSSRGVFLQKITRSGAPVMISTATQVQRGDILTIVGAKVHLAAAEKDVGYADRVTDATDMALVGIGIILGALVGIPAVRAGALELGLSESVGVLLGGLVFGWLRSVKPILGRIPGPTLWLFESLGLTGFIAVVGLQAGPDFVRGLKEAGIGLLLAAFITVITPHLVTVLVGSRLMKMHPGLVLGVAAGAGTATPALAAVQERAQSAVPTLSYGVSYAVGNVFLALWGTVIVALLRP